MKNGLSSSGIPPKNRNVPVCDVSSEQILAESGRLKQQPFCGMAKSSVQGALRRLTVELAGRAVIRHPYSAHDFRHLFSVRYYEETHHIYGLKEELGHSTVGVTEMYLAGLGALSKAFLGSTRRRFLGQGGTLEYPGISLKLRGIMSGPS